MLTEYFAGKPTDEVGLEIYDRVEKYLRHIEANGYFGMLRKSYCAYYGMNYHENSTGQSFTSAAITRGGMQGEAYNLKINQYRNINQHLLNLITAERVAYESMAENTDWESQSQSLLSDGLLENFQTEKRIERDQVRVAEYSTFLGSGYLIPEWDVNAGRRYGTNEFGMPLFEGDLKLSAKTPLDVYFDPRSSTPNTKWKIVKGTENKYDLIAQLPELAEEIESIERKNHELERFHFSVCDQDFDSDDIPLYHFYHEKTPAVEHGRLVSILPGGKVIYDGPLPYEKVTIQTFQPYNIEGGPFGYCPAFDLLAIQDAIDNLCSTVLTNQMAFGKTLLWLPKGHNISYNQLAQGLGIIETDPKLGKPEPINFTQTPPEVFNFIKDLIGFAEQIAGLNSVVRGNPEGALKGASGAAMALLASQAIQFANGFQREWEFFNEDVGTTVIGILKEYAQTPRIAQIVGKSKRSYLKQWKGSDLQRVTKVRIKRTSAMAKTTSGKMAIADNLLQHGSIGPEQYLNFIKTGNLDTMTDAPMSRGLRIKRENEMLADGMQVPVLRTDPHELDIQEHLTVLDDPEARMNPAIVQNVLAHVQEHEMYIAQAQMAQMQAGGGAPQDPAQMNTPQPGPDQMTAPPGAEAMQDAMPSQPGMPNNPLTGENFQPATFGEIEYTGG